MQENQNQETNWYTIKVQNNYEARVAERIKLEMERSNKSVKIVIPKERVVKIKNGKKDPKEKILYPGYIFAETVNIGELLNIVRYTTGATNVLSDRDRQPIKLKRSEVIQMLLADEELKKPMSEEVYIVGETVKIIDGPFTDFQGKIEAINYETGKVNIGISIFGKIQKFEMAFDAIMK